MVYYFISFGFFPFYSILSSRSLSLALSMALAFSFFYAILECNSSSFHSLLLLNCSRFFSLFVREMLFNFFVILVRLKHVRWCIFVCDWDMSICKIVFAGMVSPVLLRRPLRLCSQPYMLRLVCNFHLIIFLVIVILRKCYLH